jgi:hypothetical protein
MPTVFSLPVSTKDDSNSTIGSFFLPKSRKPNEKMAAEFMGRYDQEGAAIVDWIELADDVRSMKDQLWEYSNSQHLTEGLTVFTTDDKEMARKMEELHLRYAASEQAVRSNRDFVKNAEEARRHGEAKMAEFSAKGDFTGRFQFLRMRNAAQKVLKEAETILEKEKKKVRAIFSTPTPQRTIDITEETQTVIGTQQTVSPLSAGGVSNNNQPSLLAPTSKDDDPDMDSVVAYSVVDLHQDSGDDVATASATRTPNNSSKPVRRSVLNELQEANVAAVAEAAHDSSNEGEEASSDSNSIIEEKHHHQFEKAKDHKSRRDRKVRKFKFKNPDEQEKKKRKRPPIIFSADVFLAAEETGFKLNGKKTRPSQQGFRLSGSAMVCAPCGKTVVWGSHTHHALSRKHVAKLAKWEESEKADQLLLTQHAEWQGHNNVQGMSLPAHIKNFRLDVLKMCCVGNISLGAVPYMENLLTKHTGKTLGGYRGVADNIPFLW